MAAHAGQPLLLEDARVLAETRKKVSDSTSKCAAQLPTPAPLDAVLALYVALVQVIWDRIHGYMGFHPVIVTFIDTKQFQRLRYIKQLGE